MGGGQLQRRQPDRLSKGDDDAGLPRLEMEEQVDGQPKADLEGCGAEESRTRGIGVEDHAGNDEEGGEPIHKRTDILRRFSDICVACIVGVRFHVVYKLYIMTSYRWLH